jgi:glucokinase
MSKGKWAIGVDLGGTKIEIALIDTKGKIHARKRFPTESKKGYKVILTRIAQEIATMSHENKKSSPIIIGIGVAGQIEKKTGVVKYSPNLEWHNVSLQKDLAEELKIPVIVCNDVKAAMLGEWYYGAGKKCNDLVCVFVGTGIGGGIISNGKILEGSNNTAGEIGHMTIDLHGPKCHCGNTGCFEAIAGGWAIARDAQKAIKENKTAGKLLLKIAGDIKNVSAKTLEEAVKQNDKLSKELRDEVAGALIAGGVSIVNAFGPKRFIFGGGIIEGMAELLPVIKRGIKKRALQAAVRSIEIMPAKLHNDSGVVGAAAYAFHTLKKK